MIKEAVLVLAGMCSDPELWNLTQEEFTNVDYALVEQAQERCTELYIDAPCVGKFFKFYTETGDITYHAQCKGVE